MRIILLMNDLPGASPKRRLVKRNEQGAHDLIITLTQDTAYGFYRFDNRGSRYAGPFQFWMGGGANSWMGLWDNTQARFVTAAETEELRFTDISHSQIITNEGTRLRIGASISRSKPGYTRADDLVDSRGMFASIGLDHAVIRSRSQGLYAGANFNFLNSKRDELGSQTIDDKIRVARLSLRYVVVDAIGKRNNAAIYLSRGLDAHQGRDLASRTGTPHDFTKASFGLSRF